MNSSEHDLSLPTPCEQTRQRTFSDAFLLFLLSVACLTGARSAAQSTSDGDTIRGIVVNSVAVSRFPCPGFSPDNRFATLTKAEGRFEFPLSKLDPAVEGDSDSSMPRLAPITLVPTGSLHVDGP